MIDAVIQKLKTDAPAFNGRVDGAAALSALMERKALPAQTPAAHVMPMALRGASASAAAGAFVQETRETIGIVMTVRPHDRVGAAGVEPIEALKAEVIAALAGWAPGNETGVFEIASGQMTSVAAGAVVYTLQFQISDQVRILS